MSNDGKNQSGPKNSVIPPLDHRGLLPAGKHLASWSELLSYFSADSRRCYLVNNARTFALNELAPKYPSAPLFLAGSSLSDKAVPADIEMTLRAPSHPLTPETLQDCIDFRQRHAAIKAQYEVDFYLYLEAPGFPDFSEFFQYVGDKTAAVKHLQSKDKRGIIEVSKWIHG